MVFTIYLQDVYRVYSNIRLLAIPLEFEVQGGVIFDSEQGSGQRRLTIVAAQGYKFGIARDRGGSK